jgi:hypothetical protein
LPIRSARPATTSSSGATIIAAEALEPVRTATSVKIRNGKMTVTDGPFAKRRSSLRVLPARSRRPEQAIQLAAGPPARLGVEYARAATAA